MCVLAVRLELKWSQDKSICKSFTCFVCVDDMVRLGVWSLGKDTSFYFS